MRIFSSAAAGKEKGGQPQPVAGLRLFIDGGQVGLDRPFGHVEIGKDKLL